MKNDLTFWVESGIFKGPIIILSKHHFKTRFIDLVKTEMLVRDMQEKGGDERSVRSFDEVEVASLHRRARSEKSDLNRHSRRV